MVTNVPSNLSTLTPSLIGVGMIGIGTPKIIKGVASGLALWASSRSVSTVDAGTVGVGKGFFPLVPPISLLPNLQINTVSEKMLGIFTPTFLSGLASGLSLSLATGFLSTSHPSVGVGVAIATISGPPGRLSFLQGFEGAGVTGETGKKLAKVIGNSLDTIYATPLITPIPIVGSPSPTSSSGFGVGKLL